MIPIEHSNGINPNNNPNNNQRGQHYTSELNLSENGRFPVGGYEVHSSDRRQTPNSAHEASQSQMLQSHYDYQNNSRVMEEEQRQTKKSTQTTTSNTLQQPSYMAAQINNNEHEPFTGHKVEVFQPINGPYGLQTSLEMTDKPDHYSIKVAHHPNNHAFNWSNLDIYLHIFLTFYFGLFAAMLFFDGILRNIVNLYVMEQTTGSIFIYVLHILLSIAFLAFTTWFMTICWRWWRYKSLTPSNSPANFDYQNRPVRAAKQASANSHVFVSALILILGFFVFLVLGSLDIAFKKEQVANSDLFRTYNKSLYMADMIVFGFRLVLWLVGIVATLLLSRECMYKHCCPSKQIRINKERPTTVYEVQG